MQLCQNTDRLPLNNLKKLKKTETKNMQKFRPKNRRSNMRSKKFDFKLKPDSVNSKLYKINRFKKNCNNTNCNNTIDPMIDISNLKLRSPSSTSKPININIKNGKASITNPTIKKKRGRPAQSKNVIKKERCLARIANGDQCHRNATPRKAKNKKDTDDKVETAEKSDKDDEEDKQDLCSCHIKHCPYGKINGPLQGKFLNIPRKRGPRAKNDREYQLEELDSDLYQKTDMVKINGGCYLIDEFGLLFKNDSSCEIVGRRIKNEIHWYC
tara:strand:- start:897 stop:1703 length:807 start_codon:yes stop_codon:yes gene_type:complete